MLAFISANEECILEAARVFGNLSQIQQVRHFMVDNSMDKLFVALLDSTNRELVFTSGKLRRSLNHDQLLYSICYPQYST